MKFAKKPRGFLILEAAVAFILVSIGMMGLIMLSIKGSRATQESFERTEAVNLASLIVAKVRSSGDGLLEWHNVDVANSATWTSSHSATLLALNEMKQVANDRLSTPIARITLRAPDGITNCAAAPCAVQVDVSWMGATQKQQNYSLTGWAGLQL